MHQEILNTELKEIAVFDQEILNIEITVLHHRYTKYRYNSTIDILNIDTTVLHHRYTTKKKQFFYQKILNIEIVILFYLNLVLKKSLLEEFLVYCTVVPENI